MFASHLPYIEADDGKSFKVSEFIIENRYYDYPSSLFGKIKKGISIIFGTKIEDKKKCRFDWEREVFEEPKLILEKRVNAVFEVMNGASAYELLLNIYARNVVNVRNGAFESQFGEKRSVYPYTPWTALAGKTWNPKGITCGSKVLIKELLRKEAPALAAIGEEGYAPAPGKEKPRFAKIRKISAMLDFVVRGDGSHLAKKYFKNREIQQSFMEDMDNQCTWFWKITGLKKENIKDMKRINYHEFLSIWDLKRLLDCLEMGRYMRF